MALAVRTLDDAAAPAWDAFVQAMPGGTFCHRAAWARVIEKAFGHRTLYCFTERDGAITGVLPLAHVKTLLFGNTLISNPFCVYGGVLAADEESAAALEAHAAALLRQTRATAVEFRDRTAVELRDRTAAAFDDPTAVELRDRTAASCERTAAPEADGWVARPDLYVTFRKSIEGDHDRNMKAIPRKQRAMVRKGIQNGLTSVCHRDTAVLHRIYAESVRNLGTPVVSRRYFDILLQAFGDAADIVTILDQDRPIGSVMNFYFREEVLPYYGGGTTEARHRAGNDFMYWDVMRRAADRGCRLFDFGRSKIGTGAYAFKHNWGFEAAPLHYRYLLAQGAAIPDHNPLNPKYRLFIAAWKRLPLPVAKLLGPPIVRGLG